MKKIFYALSLGLISCASTFAQINDKDKKDSLFIDEVENKYKSDKVLHAEPLYIDLIRDLGARKGEKEWNIGLGLTDKLDYDEYEALIEYEWAPINRLGLEVELPFTIYSGLPDSIDKSGLNSLKLAAQWSFLVNEKYATSMALGYINEFTLSKQNISQIQVNSNVFNPFLVVAKRWGQNFHSLVYTGPHLEWNYRKKSLSKHYELNTSIHYMVDGTRNFVGIEFNQSFSSHNNHFVLRPQMRLAINEQLMLGVVAGIPISRDAERISSFLRLIWEPKH